MLLRIDVRFLREESKSNLPRVEIPLLEDRLESFHECEDERIAESTEKREPEYNRFGEKHLEGPPPNHCDLSTTESLLFQLVRAPDILPILTALLSFLQTVSIIIGCGQVSYPIKNDSGACLRNDKEVNNLDHAAHDK